MSAKKIIAISTILVAVIGLGVIGAGFFVPGYNPLQIPPPSEPPGEEPEANTQNGLEAWAEAIYWQDFMPGSSSENPPFYTVIWVNVTNTGSTTVTSFHAVRVTIYFYNTSLPLATLDLTSSIQYFVWPEIRPGETVSFEFTNVRDSVFSPTVEEDTLLYSRLLTRWENGSEMILTTPPSALLYTH